MKAWGHDPKTRGVVERFEAQIARDPDDAYAYVNMGPTRVARGRASSPHAPTRGTEEGLVRSGPPRRTE
jgi:hypothetical protein